jgi:hypothetical protein
METIDRQATLDRLRALQAERNEVLAAMRAAEVQGEALEELLRRKGANIVTFVFRTVPTMNKTGNPFFVNGENVVRKTVRVNGVVGFDYEKRLAKAHEKAGTTDDRKSRGSWHEPILNENGKPTALSMYKGDPERLYVRFAWTRYMSTVYEDVRTGEPIDVEKLEPFFSKRPPNPSHFLAYGVEGIREVVVNGKVFKVGE